PPAAVGARLLSRAESLACRLGPTTARLHPGSAAPRPGAIPAPSRSPTAAQLTTRTTKLVRGGKGAVCPRVEVTSSTRAHPLRRAVRIETSRWCWPPGAKFRLKRWYTADELPAASVATHRSVPSPLGSVAAPASSSSGTARISPLDSTRYTSTRATPVQKSVTTGGTSRCVFLDFAMDSSLGSIVLVRGWFHPVRRVVHEGWTGNTAVK